MTGTILYGMNNIYTVYAEKCKIECRIKGKVLPQIEEDPPLAPGDLVEINLDEQDKEKGLIINRQERENIFRRWNSYTGRYQAIAANLDLVCIISSPKSPPFRPRFLDRVILNAEMAGLPVLIIINKKDQGIDKKIQKRMDFFHAAGYDYLYCSAKEGSGIVELKQKLAGKRSLFFGQSGAGKSSILNCLDPNLDLKVAPISKKYNRGKHTTCFARLTGIEDGRILIDTPGIRTLEFGELAAEDLIAYFPDIQPFAAHCPFASCSHLREQKCAVKQAVEQGKIHEDRYQSYSRIYQQLEEDQANKW